MLVSVIVPVYNEEKTVALVIQKIREVKLDQRLRKGIVIIDDGSCDRTSHILKEYQNSPDIRILTQPVNLGKTPALVRGIKEASGDIILIQDADLEYDPSDFSVLLTPIVEEKTKIVYGSRFKGRIDAMHPVNGWANRFSNITFNFLYGQHLTDINTCYKVFKREVLDGIEINSGHFAFETEITAKLVRKGQHITEVPITYRARTNSDGKKINWLTAVHMYWGIFRYRF